MELTQIQQLILATKGNNFAFKIWEVACIQDVIRTREV